MGKQNFWERTSLNIVTNIARTAVMALIGIFLIPYYLDNLGASVYGVLPLATTISSYVLIISDSLVGACGRYVTLAIRKNDDSETLKAFNTALFGILRVCLFFVPIVLVVSFMSPYVFNVPHGMNSDVQLMFALILLSSLVVSFTTAFNSIFLAYNRMYLVYLARLSYTLVQVALIFLLFTFSDPSLIDIGVAYMVSAFVLLAVTYYLSLKIRGKLRIDFHVHDRELFKAMGVLSIWAIGAKIGNLLYIEFSLILVNLYLGSAVEAGFAIVSTVISMVSTAVVSISPSIEPIVYRLYAEEREPDIIKTVLIGEKCLGFMMAMPIAFLLVFCTNILTTWVGSEYVYLSDLIYISMLACLTHCCALAMGDIPVLYLKNQWTMISTVIFGVANAVVTLLVLEYTDLGVNGAMGVWAVCFFGQKLSNIIICKYITHAQMREYLFPVVQSYAVLALCYVLLYGLSCIIDIGTSWLTIIPIFLVLFVIFMLAMFKFLLPKDDLDIVKNILPGFLKKFVSKL